MYKFSSQIFLGDLSFLDLGGGGGGRGGLSFLSMSEFLGLSFLDTLQFTTEDRRL